MKKIRKITGTILTILLFTLSILIFRSGMWMLDTWAHLTMEELIFHLKAPISGTSPELISNYIRTCLLSACLIGMLLFVTLFLLRKNKALYRTAHGIALAISPFLIGFTIYHVWSNLELTDYVESQMTYSDFIDINYVDPSDVSLTFPSQKRNLIHIYLESMETTYAHTKIGGAFEENIVPEITELAQIYEDFSGFRNKINGAHVLYGSTWTMGALFAQTSGLPLSLPIDGNAMGGQDSFLPKLAAMGDILNDQGYQQAFLIGSQGEFGGRKLYFQDHGDYKIWDYYHFVENGHIPSDYFVWWGFEDRYLTEFAKEKLTWLSQQAQPFNLTMLTADTHYEDGYLCPDCPTYSQDNPYADVMRCSSHRVKELISWIQEQDFYENTTIVLTGDHLTMDSDFCSNVPADYQRKVFTIYINAPFTTETTAYRDYCTYDIFPTTLASLGVEIEGERLGLGTNLFSDTPTLCEEYGVDYIHQELQKKSEFMEDLTSDVAYANGTVSVTPYKPLNQAFSVQVQELHYSISIQDIRCLIWTEEDRSDGKWYILPYSEGDGYIFTIPVSDFSNQKGIYYTEVFAYGENTMMYSLGTGEIVVK